MTINNTDSGHQGEMAILMSLVRQAERLGANLKTPYLDLVVASPAFVVLLYVSAWDAIQASEACEVLKAATTRSLQAKTTQLLQTVLAVVQSDDPGMTLLQHGITLAAAEMGESPSDEVH